MYFLNGNFTIVEDFTSDKLHPRWIGLRGPREAFIEMTRKGLKINPFDAHIRELKPTSTLFHRQQHDVFTFTTSMIYQPDSKNDLAGITCLQNEGSNYVFGITKIDGDYVLLLERNWWPGRKGEKFSKIVAMAKIDVKKPIRLQVAAEGDDYQFNYSTDGKTFKNLGGIVSGDILSTNVAGGFTGTLIGLYATSNNASLPEN